MWFSAVSGALRTGLVCAAPPALARPRLPQFCLMNRFGFTEQQILILRDDTRQPDFISTKANIFRVSGVAWCRIDESPRWRTRYACRNTLNLSVGHVNLVSPALTCVYCRAVTGHPVADDGPAAR